MERFRETLTNHRRGVAANLIAGDYQLDATILLLQDRSPDQITVRDVAQASGHHHRFVQAWFGGKVGLLREAFDRLRRAAAAAASRVRPGRRTPR